MRGRGCLETNPVLWRFGLDSCVHRFIDEEEGEFGLQFVSEAGVVAEMLVEIRSNLWDLGAQAEVLVARGILEGQPNFADGFLQLFVSLGRCSDIEADTLGSCERTRGEVCEFADWREIAESVAPEVFGQFSLIPGISVAWLVEDLA